MFENLKLEQAERHCAKGDALGAPSSADNRKIIETALADRIHSHLVTRATQYDAVSDDQICRMLHHYSSMLSYIRVSHTVADDSKHTLTEEEVFIGSIFAKTSQPRKRQVSLNSHHACHSVQLTIYPV